MNRADLSSIMGRIALLEDKVATLATLTALVSTFKLLSPDVVELKLSVSTLTLDAVAETARTPAVKVSQSEWNSAIEKAVDATHARSNGAASPG